MTGPPGGRFPRVPEGTSVEARPRQRRLDAVRLPASAAGRRRYRAQVGALPGASLPFDLVLAQARAAVVDGDHAADAMPGPVTVTLLRRHLDCMITHSKWATETHKTSKLIGSIIGCFPFGENLFPATYSLLRRPTEW
jgi:hypothetical protein